MELTFANFMLIVALAVVCFLFGRRVGSRNGYAVGHADGMFAGERYVKELLTESELTEWEKRDKERCRKFIEGLRQQGIIK